MMKILMINSGVYGVPTSKGGLENVVYRLSNELARLGHRVDLVTDVSGESYFHENITIYHVGLPRWRILKKGFWGYVLRHVLGGFLAFWRARALLKNEYNVIHVHGRLGPLLLASYCKGRHNLVYTIHDDAPDRRIQHFRIFETSYKLCVEPAAKRATRVIVLHQQGYESMVKIGIPRDRIRVIPNGVDTSIFKVNGHRRGTHCIFIGSLVYRKGVHYLLKALKDVKNLSCLVVGDGPERNNLEKQARELCIDDRIEFLGLIDDPHTLAKIYSEASFLVLPSLTEGMPLVIPEAMACGTPAVASFLPGNTSMIRDGENGLLFQPSDIDDLAEKLHRMAASPDDCRCMGQKAHEHVRKLFSLTSVVQNTLKLYEEMADQPQVQYTK